MLAPLRPAVKANGVRFTKITKIWENIIVIIGVKWIESFPINKERIEPRLA